MVQYVLLGGLRMARKYNKSSNFDSLSHAIQKIKIDASAASKEPEIVDIITFCDSPLYLNLPNNGLNLYMAQRIILKTFYMGDIGNKNVKLTKEEWGWLYANEANEIKDGDEYERNIKDVIQKLLRKERDSSLPRFSLLQLVLGRRSGKTLLASIITAYEAYKLLVINDGDPQGHYRLPSGDEIAIINVALSQDQATILFDAITARIRDSTFFQGKIAGATSDEIRLFTKKDFERKEKQKELKVPGSILLRCGHSNPDSLAGRNAILILFDEMAFFDETGKVTGKYFYNRLKPSLSRFYKQNAGKIVMISSPNTRMGIFWETFEYSKAEDTTLSYQLPTWTVNDEVPYDLPEMQKDRRQNIDVFRIEFGAQWAAAGSFGNLFDPGTIDRCIRGDLMPHTKPQPMFNYYLHVDPAKGGNNYSAVLVAKERYTNHLGKKRNRCILAGAWVWRPVPGIGLQFNSIDKDVIKICSIFHPLIVSYDDYHSVHSLQLLRAHGVNTRQIPFNRHVKMKIYQNLMDLMAYEPQPELYLYDDGGEASLLIQELKALKKKRIQRGFAILTDKHGDVTTDDLSDCLAGACAAANEGLQPALPEPVVVNCRII